MGRIYCLRSFQLLPQALTSGKVAVRPYAAARRANPHAARVRARVIRDHVHPASSTAALVAHKPPPAPGGPNGPARPAPGDQRYAQATGNGRPPSALRGHRDRPLASRHRYLWSPGAARADCHEPPEGGCANFRDQKHNPVR